MACKGIAVQLVAARNSSMKIQPLQRQDTVTAPLIDRFGRRVDYLRVSVTDKCDLRCSYCIPKGFRGFEEPENWLRFDENERVVAAFARMGTRRIRLTGGEPLLRRDLPRLVEGIARHTQVTDISLSTNATQLFKYANDLYLAGVNRINLSLDSLDSLYAKNNG